MFILMDKKIFKILRPILFLFIWTVVFQTVSSSVLNTTFDVEESPTKSEPVPPKPSAKVTGKPPLKSKKQKSDAGRSVLGPIKYIDNSVRSSDEFEQSMMRKTQSSSSLRQSTSMNKGDKANKSSSNIRKTSSSSGLRKRASSNTELDKLGKGNTEDSVSGEGLQKKRKLFNARESFFQDIYKEDQSTSWLL